MPSPKELPSAKATKLFLANAKQTPKVVVFKQNALVIIFGKSEAIEHMTKIVNVFIFVVTFILDNTFFFTVIARFLLCCLIKQSRKRAIAIYVVSTKKRQKSRSQKQLKGE